MTSAKVCFYLVTSDIVLVTKLLSYCFRNFSVLSQTFDNPDKMEGYPFARILFKDSSVKITLSGILRYELVMKA